MNFVQEPTRRQVALFCLLITLLPSAAPAQQQTPAVQSFCIYFEAENFTGVSSSPGQGQWSRTSGTYLGGEAILDQNTNTTDSVSYTFHVPTNGTYSIWLAHLTSTNQNVLFTCRVEQGGSTGTNLQYATLPASPTRTDSNYVYQTDSWMAWSKSSVVLQGGAVALKLLHNASATAASLVDAVQVVGDSQFVPDWLENVSKPFSYFVEAETFDGGTNTPLNADGSPTWVFGWWNIWDYIYASGGQEAVALYADAHPLTHTFTVPKAGTYYLWMEHYVNPYYLVPDTCVVEQDGQTVTNLVFGSHTPSIDRDDPDYHFRPGFWTCWSVHPATLAAGPVTLKVYYNDPGIQSSGQWDAMHIVDDPAYVPGFSPLARTDVPDFRFRFRIDSITAPSAPSNTAWYLVNYNYPLTFWMTNYQWSAWLDVSGDLKEALLNSYPNSYSGIWPFSANFVFYPPGIITNMTLTVEWETAIKSGSYTATYLTGNFGVLLWRNSPAPMPHVCGPSSEFNQRYISLGAGLTTNDIPRQFTIVDRFMGVDYEVKAWTEGLDLLHRLGINTISTEGYPAGKSALAQLGVTKTSFAVYVPPYIFDADLSQTTDAAMDTWAQGQAAAVTNAGWDVTDVGWYGMSDEPAWYDPYQYTHSGPDLPGVFRAYLQNKGFLPGDFGAADWSGVDFIGRGSATTLPTKRLHYWTQRFFAENSADVYSRYAQAMERAFYPGLLMTVNWNNFGGRYYTPGPFGYNPDATSPDAATGGHDWIDFGRHRGITGLWTEDWFSDDYARRWSYFASKLRSGANKYNDSRTNNAPPAIRFGGYVVGGTAGAKAGGTLQKVLAILGHGGK
ncbi:hypothetical protein HQ590_15390, partial [bacterium]|nr:hypothetical protein [bacterium]